MPEFPRLFPERDESEVQARANERLPILSSLHSLQMKSQNCYGKTFGKTKGLHNVRQRCSLLVPTCNYFCSGDSRTAQRLYSNLDRYFELWGKPTQLLDATWRSEISMDLHGSLVAAAFFIHVATFLASACLLVLRNGCNSLLTAGSKKSWLR